MDCLGSAAPSAAQSRGCEVSLRAKTKFVSVGGCTSETAAKSAGRALHIDLHGISGALARKRWLGFNDGRDEATIKLCFIL